MSDTGGSCNDCHCGERKTCSGSPARLLNSEPNMAFKFLAAETHSQHRFTGRPLLTIITVLHSMDGTIDDCSHAATFFISDSKRLPIPLREQSTDKDEYLLTTTTTRIILSVNRTSMNKRDGAGLSQTLYLVENARGGDVVSLALPENPDDR